MLSNVSLSISHSVRQVVLSHPNTMDCTVWRKRVARVENDPGTGLPSEMGGSPTLGGMGMLRSEDESDFTYEELGAAKCMFCGVFQQADQVERDNAVLQQNMQEAQVESVIAPGAVGYFQADTTDMVLITPGMGTVLAFEVASLLSPGMIPPYVRKLVLNPLDDLHSLIPFA